MHKTEINKFIYCGHPLLVNRLRSDKGGDHGACGLDSGEYGCVYDHDKTDYCDGSGNIPCCMSQKPLQKTIAIRFLLYRSYFASIESPDFICAQSNNYL